MVTHSDILTYMTQDLKVWEGDRGSDRPRTGARSRLALASDPMLCPPAPGAARKSRFLGMRAECSGLCMSTQYRIPYTWVCLPQESA